MAVNLYFLGQVVVHILCFAVPDIAHLVQFQRSTTQSTPVEIVDLWAEVLCNNKRSVARKHIYVHFYHCLFRLTL